ncbi:MAG: hypothetical protein [Inoviridae sp.]|nr:MAG: hypothetical protein [Inoviridae sp.]
MTPLSSSINPPLCKTNKNFYCKRSDMPPLQEKKLCTMPNTQQKCNSCTRKQDKEHNKDNRIIRNKTEILSHNRNQPGNHFRSRRQNGRKRATGRRTGPIDGRIIM